MVKAGVELAFETMTSAGIIADSAYYESLHETPLIANTIARKKLYEMNATISDTAEYGCYLYNHACLPLLQDFMKKIKSDVIGKGLQLTDTGVDNESSAMSPGSDPEKNVTRSRILDSSIVTALQPANSVGLQVDRTRAYVELASG
ncbi:PREDICTED: ketol-acid reductoisomerase-like, partial [Priapulus caudatus]|uniref:Acetohydroxy-acid reductoisomerase n=1 Tax=Priapulus caudatus TaxID=37621 RepID=A0ABM1F7E5_PRICU